MSYLSKYSSVEIHRWLTGQRLSLSEFGSHADQDIDSDFACERRPEQLFELLRTPGIIGSRAFDIASAICCRIIWLSDVADLPEEVHSEEDRQYQLRQLVTFVSEHRVEFDHFHEINSLGADYERFVIPLVERMRQ